MRRSASRFVSYTHESAYVLAKGRPAARPSGAHAPEGFAQAAVIGHMAQGPAGLRVA